MSLDLTSHLLFAVPGTADAVRQRRKDVTRRLASRGGCRWRLGAWSRCYERDPRAKGKPFGIVQILDVRLEELSALASYANDVDREGFQGMSNEAFREMFLEMHGLYESANPNVWRIVFGPILAPEPAHE
jgi:hypothetical protein